MRPFLLLSTISLLILASQLPRKTTATTEQFLRTPHIPEQTSDNSNGEPSTATRRKNQTPKKSMLSPTQFSELLSSEANTLLTSTGTWNAATSLEWSLIHGRHLQTSRKRELTGSNVTHDSPFVACITEHNKTGRARMEEYWNAVSSFDDRRSNTERDNFYPVYNKDDKTCIISNIPFQTAERMTEGGSSMVLQPLLPEMKLEEGLLERLNSVSNGGEFSIQMCPGSSGGDEQGNGIAGMFLDFVSRDDAFGDWMKVIRPGEKNDDDGDRFRHLLKHEGGERRRLFDFIANRPTSCDALWKTLKVTLSRLGDNITVKFPRQVYLGKIALPECLQSIVGRLSVRYDVCHIDLKAESRFWNDYAQWIMQTGVEDKKPFYTAGLTGRGQVVALSDSGLDMENCYFCDCGQSGILPTDGTVDMNQRKVVQYISSSQNNDSLDENSGHGTHVAGSIAGKRFILDHSDETAGVADGMAPDAKIAFMDIYVENEGMDMPPDLDDVFRPGLELGAMIHSVSWGGSENDYSWQDSAFDKFMFQNRDFLIIVAAGNKGVGNAPNTVGMSALAKNCLAIGATQSEGRDLKEGMLGMNYLADFSSRGPTGDGRSKPDVLAPGFKIASVKARVDMTDECDNNRGITYKKGTSMSAPLVSGAAALVRQYFQEGWYPHGRNDTGTAGFSPSGALVKAVLINGAQFIQGVQSKNLTVIFPVYPYDFDQNFGRVSLIHSLPLWNENNFAMLVKEVFIEDGDNHTYDIYIYENQTCDYSELRATLVWVDPPSIPGCIACVLNDLDLTVTHSTPNGITTLFPNGRDTPDRLNNAEQVRVGQVEDEQVYSIHVNAHNLLMQKMEYALVVTGCFNLQD